MSATPCSPCPAGWARQARRGLAQEDRMLCTDASRRWSQSSGQAATDQRRRNHGFWRLATMPHLCDNRCRQGVPEGEVKLKSDSSDFQLNGAQLRFSDAHFHFCACPLTITTSDPGVGLAAALGCRFSSRVRQNYFQLVSPCFLFCVFLASCMFI